MSPSAPASERGRVGNDDTLPEERKAIYLKILRWAHVQDYAHARVATG